MVDTYVWLIIIALGAYLLGSLPVSYWAARLSRGIDLRNYGTSQVGAGNLFRMTRSWKIGLAVSLFDVGKGALTVWLAWTMGMTIAQQIAVGLAVVVGHNWPVFLRFSGGRGIGSALGLIIVFPVLNGYPAWDFVAFAGILVIGIGILRSTPLPVLVGLTALPAISYMLGEPAEISYGFLALLIIIIIKRLTANRPVGPTANRWKVLLNRLLFDRDIRDRKAWMYRTPSGDEARKTD